jgi:acyl carrier protein
MQLEQIRGLVLQHARLPVPADSITFTSDLYEAGLTSLTTVHLMLALEDAFEVEFPDRLLSRKTFDSVQSIAEAIEEMRAGG